MSARARAAVDVVLGCLDRKNDPVDVHALLGTVWIPHLCGTL